MPASLVAGVLLAHSLFFSGLGAWPAIVILALWALFRRSALVLTALLALAWASLVLQLNLADRLDPQLNGSTLTVEGRIEGLPEVYGDYTRFRFQPEARRLTMPLPHTLPHTLLAYWYRNPPALAPGELWQLEVQLKPPWGRVNFDGSDRERWLFAEAIGGLATVRSGERLQELDTYHFGWHAWRHAVRERIYQAHSDHADRAIVAALALADRSGLTPRQREILSRTGTAHLLAISGLHIGLAALFGFWLTRLLIMLVPLSWSAGKAYPAALLSSLAAAVVYAALAGFGTSTVRALVMLAVGVLVLLTRRTVHPGRAILSALAVVLILDPLAILGAGFWLSFSAVGVLLLLFSGGSGADQGWWRVMLRAQAGIMVVLLPLGAFWFQMLSPSGFIANLVAIPWVSAIVVPLVLLGLILMPLSAVLSSWAFSIATHAANLLLRVLGALAGLPAASLPLIQPSLWLLGLASLGALCLLLPRGLGHRWLGLLLLLPLFAVARPPTEQQIRLDVLDVGQGTAMLVNSHRHLLLYDSGPGDGEDFDLVDQVIVPAVLQSGHPAPDRILISHADLDHAGGLGRLQQRYPGALIHASLPRSVVGIQVCKQGLQWEWDGMSFRVLHPSAHLPYLGNDSSCVLSVETATLTMLLPGDISTAIEQRLLRGGIGPLDFLLVPHHGSKTSSSADFLSAVQPGMAVATAGLGNRFGFPRPAVRQRYLDVGTPLWSTDACGAIRIELDAVDTIRVFSARKIRAAPWRWPAADFCP